MLFRSIASGAVALPEVGVAAGVVVAGVATGMATATGIAAVRENPACWACKVGSTAALPSVLDVEVDVDLVVPLFDVLEFALEFAWEFPWAFPWDCWFEPVPAAPFELAPALLALASEGGPELLLLLLLLLGSLLAGWLAAALLALFAGAEL